MNFIIKLFKFKDLKIDVIYDLILVIIDRFIKYSHIISCYEPTEGMGNTHRLRTTWHAKKGSSCQK